MKKGAVCISKDESLFGLWPSGLGVKEGIKYPLGMTVKFLLMKILSTPPPPPPPHSTPPPPFLVSEPTSCFFR